jgi:hypothetical protein
MRSAARRSPARASADLRLLLCALAALILGACDEGGWLVQRMATSPL